jgi:hypothetical protein
MDMGDLSIGIYLDEQCSVESSLISYFDYVIAYEQTYNNKDKEQGLDKAMWLYQRLKWWNEQMDTYKVCQPCPAYSRTISSSSNSGKDSKDKDNHDEQWGYNCHDVSGNINCNLVRCQ